MPQQTREIRRRIKAVTSTQQITRAMELVASAKMRRVTQSLLQTRPYTDWSWQLLQHVSERTDPSRHPLLARRYPIKRQALVLLTTNRGLVGAFNANLINAAMKAVQSAKAQQIRTDLVLMGTKGQAVVYRYGLNVVADFPKADIAIGVQDVRPLSKLIIGEFMAGKVDQVSVVFMDYRSTLFQKPVVRQVLPLDAQAFVATGQIESEPTRKGPAASSDQNEYLFEPSPEAVLDVLLQKLVELQIFRALLETNASEQAARMMAMRNASDAASDLLEDLTLTLNQARQAGITQDLSEISAGRAALEA